MLMMINGQMINWNVNPDDLAQVCTNAGPGGAIDTITAGPDSQGYFYKQTLTYTGANVTGISAWVKQ